MSQMPPKPPNPYPNSPYQSPPSVGPPVQENTAGTIGFVMSLLGLLFCPIFSVIGLFMSWSAMKNEPKGLATAGLVIGIFGTIGLVITIIVLVIVFGGLFTIAATGAAGAQYYSEQVPQRTSVSIIVEEYDGESIPTQAEGDALLKGETDVWGRQIRFSRDEDTFSVSSDGPDGLPETGDDLMMGPYSSIKEASIAANGFDSDWTETTDWEEIGKEFDREFDRERKAAGK